MTENAQENEQPLISGLTDEERQKLKHFTLDVQENERYVSPKILYKEWTEQENARLLESFFKCRGNFQEIAKLMGKSKNTCIVEFSKIIDRPWTREEEDLLRTWYEYEDGNTYINIKGVCQQLPRHPVLAVERRLQTMTECGFYKKKYYIGTNEQRIRANLQKHKEKYLKWQQRHPRNAQQKPEQAEKPAEAK